MAKKNIKTLDTSNKISLLSAEDISITGTTALTAGNTLSLVVELTGTPVEVSLTGWSMNIEDPNSSILYSSVTTGSALSASFSYAINQLALSGDYTFNVSALSSNGTITTAPFDSDATVTVATLYLASGRTLSEHLRLRLLGNI